MKKNIFYLLLLLPALFSSPAGGQVSQKTSSQKSNSQSSANQKPKLIVGIVVDQMRYDLLWRFWDQYGNGGFKRLVNEGFLCKNARFNYLLTVTASGHASIYSGATPAIHGIVDNYYFDRNTNKDVYVMSDAKVLTVGNETGASGMSPFRLMSTTITDELKLVSRDSKVFGIALKDRSAMLPAGHFADGAFYFDGITGNWISSTWYMKQLPYWLLQFNQTRQVNNYVSSDWNLLLPRSAYTMCTGDTTLYEHELAGEKLPIFPHHLSKEKISVLPYTPFGNTMTKDLAIEAIKNEKLGKRNATDFLCISFSSTDLVGHWFGPNSLELADCYLRLDKDIENLLNYIDENIGKENCLVFLTADHGGAINPDFGKDHNISGGVMMGDSLLDAANKFVSGFYGEGKWIAAIATQQVYLNQTFIASTKIAGDDVANKVSDFLMQQEGILCVTSPKYNINLCSPTVQQTIMNNFYPERSGDIFYSMKPGWIDWIFKEGTSHGTAFSYDNHVPLIFYGWKIEHGESVEKVVIPDIAPTVSSWLNIAFPSGSTGNPIPFIKLK
ncbi:MAG: alkaline phosphatase family protein [Chitinophagales bacterium]|nr:alkaline phosphatase family protein [Chitinophagales bacterium]